MELWLEAEIRIRRADALENARRSQLARLTVSGRGTRARIRIADAVQAISEALAALASSLRNGETA